MLLYNATILLYMFSMLCSLVVLIMSIYVRSSPKSLWFSYMSLAIFIFTLGYCFEITSQSEVSAMVATKLQYIGVCYLSPFLLLFILEYCGRPFKKSFIFLILIIPTITLVLVQMWPANTLYYQSVVFVTDFVVPYLRVTGSTFYYVFYLYTYILAVWAAIVALIFYRKSKTSVRKQSMSIIIGIFITVFGNIVNIFKVSTWVLDLTPMVMSLTCILLGYSIFKQGLYRIVPIAREQIVETMSDGFVLVDMQGMFIDANSAAIRLLPQLKNITAGTQIDQIEELAWFGDTPAQGEFSVVNPDTEETTHHRISRTTIHFQQQEICNCFMIFDITDTKQLLNEVSDLAERDPLTGLAHRGTFYEKGGQLLQNMNEACLLMMDLDYFKKVNDQYGHLKGDEVLKETSVTLGKCIRSTDLLARYGGEEFCALLPSIGVVDAMELAERIRRRIEMCEFQFPKGTFHVTVSIGVAMYSSAKHASLKDLLEDADAALYDAKSAGRNIVVLAGLAH